MILDDIQILVSKNADAQTPRVIDAFFSKLKKSHIKVAHLNKCECDYCNLLRTYTASKIRLHRLTKRFYYEDLESNPELGHRIAVQQENALQLRQLKNRAKEL